MTISAEPVARAREDFAAGRDVAAGVRPEILASWSRCRDRYDVDPALRIAPAAPEHADHCLEQEVVLAELGGLAAIAGQEMESSGGLIAVADGSGRVLASYGDPEAQRRAEASNLAPRATWAEDTTGTNGLGTALETTGAVTVTGAEHWCEGFHDWACAGIAVRDVVTGAPIGMLDISRWGEPLSDRTTGWLERAARGVEAELHQRAVADGRRLVAAFAEQQPRTRNPLLGVDVGGRAVIGNDAAADLLGLPGSTPMIAPGDRREPDAAELSTVVAWAAGRASGAPDWTGSALLTTPSGERPITLRPLHVEDRLVGFTCEFGVADGEPHTPRGDHVPSPAPDRIIGLRNERLVVLMPAEVRYAEADRNTVWLSTDRGRIQAAMRGLDHVDEVLTPHGFCRVHRRFLVNMRRVAELERGGRGELLLITDPRAPEFIPVARRHVAQVRRILGV
ncbi:LytTR family transcriptional regulator DNA-binding domain-containing protein [Saccharopolyspora sp. TS4A08]|uniref:LytTR family transcriptional regulator DNA-binding domain-containing protein n=1 Tax=Saccharopolyspora ipomoeae TaxID=3042027 RepID=A0ABT6PPS2_9PSEU|nr:DNA-binding protein [Saccharopolyspora sp. TS4A08]MDI2030006.1 LytTR family transcriptional regulator DNA-binding domain-containing protein [Saccharopolyspora sp. TS4A08]